MKCSACGVELTKNECNDGICYPCAQKENFKLTTKHEEQISKYGYRETCVACGCGLSLKEKPDGICFGCGKNEAAAVQDNISYSHICGHCGNKLSDKEKSEGVCNICSDKLLASKPYKRATVICNKCGEEFYAGVGRCGFCGEPESSGRGKTVNSVPGNKEPTNSVIPAVVTIVIIGVFAVAAFFFVNKIGDTIKNEEKKHANSAKSIDGSDDSGRSVAIYLCSQAAKNLASRPDTASFSNFMDLYVKKIGSSKYTVTSTVTAENYFGVEIKSNVRCEIESGSLVDISVY